jgi:hypothetical protein
MAVSVANTIAVAKPTVFPSFIPLVVTARWLHCKSYYGEVFMTKPFRFVMLAVVSTVATTQ